MAVKRRYSLWVKSKRILRYGYYRLLRLQSTPGQMARGLGVGVFAGSFPFFGFQTLLGISLAIPFRGNALMAAAGTWVSNPLTYVPIYVFNFKLGCWLLNIDGMGLNLSTFQSLAAWREWGLDFILALMVGSLAVGLVLGFLAYWGSLTWLQRYKQRRHQHWQRSHSASPVSPPSRVR